MKRDAPPLGFTTRGTLPVHGSKLRDLAFSPDGKLVATASDDGVVRIFDTARAQEVYALADHEDAALSVAFSPSGARLASGSRDTNVRVWNTNDGALTHTFSGPASFHVVAWSPDEQFVCAVQTRELQLFHLPSLTLKDLLLGHTRWVRRARWLASGVLVSVADDGQLFTWAIHFGRPIMRASFGFVGIRDFINIPPSGTIALGCGDGSVRLWRSDIWREIATMVPAQPRPIRRLSVSYNGALLAAIDADQRLSLYAIETRLHLGTIPDGYGPIYFAAFHPLRPIVAIAVDNAVHLWNVVEAGLRQALLVAPPASHAVAVGSSSAVASLHHAEPHHLSPTGIVMTTPHPVDLAVVIALREEFRELLGVFGTPTPSHTPDLRAYAFERGAYRCVATFVGEMGETAAAIVADRLIAAWTPESIVVAGITGGIHKDIRVGDVLVPTQAEQALQDGKVEGGVFKPGAPAYRSDFTLQGAVSGLEFDHAEVFRQWRAEAQQDLESLIPSAPDRQRLLDGDLVRTEPLIHAEGHVLTVPMVIADPVASNILQGHDRHAKGVEMESAAVLKVAQSRNQPVRALAIRGISDYGDARKEELDGIGGGALRKYAMRNALRLLLALLDTESLPHRPR